MGYRKRLIAALLVALPFCSFAGAAININTADSEALVEGMKGVGPQKAMAIVRYRQQYGPFQHIDDLSQVDGIGQKTVDRNRDNLTVVMPEEGS